MYLQQRQHRRVLKVQRAPKKTAKKMILIAESKLKDALDDSIKFSEKEIGKEETVYVLADSTGKERKVIVSDHLINDENKDTIEDASTLKDIENVKGDETFKQDGSKLTWQADGNDIYYQGTSTKETPVSQTITYSLDGKEVKPEELAGKSGKVTIRFDYTNNETVKTKDRRKRGRNLCPICCDQWNGIR